MRDLTKMTNEHVDTLKQNFNEKSITKLGAYRMQAVLELWQISTAVRNQRFGLSSKP
jgi:hypothetical protein